MSIEQPSHSTAEHQPKAPKYYYISESGTLWSPMIIAGTVSTAEGEVTKYILGSPTSTESMEVPAAWFDAYKNTLEIKDGEAWSTSGKPTLETAAPDLESKPESDHIQPSEKVRENLGGEALEAVGSIELETEGDLIRQLDKLREDLSDSDRIALHLYAAALYPHEEESAVQRMSPRLRAETGRHRQAQHLMRKLSEVRKALNK